MSHDTHNSGSSEQTKSKVSFSSSFWLAIIIVGLFVAALNFIQAESKGEGDKAGAEKKTEQVGEMKTYSAPDVKTKSEDAATGQTDKSAKPADAAPAKPEEHK